LQAIHIVEFDKGQREIGQPLELRLWTRQSLLRGMLFGPTSWWLLWTVSTTLSRPIIVGIYTPVLVLCTPGWSGYSMPTSRWVRMMTAGWCFTIDPQIISQFIGVPVLQIPSSLYNEVVIPPSLDYFREFSHDIPEGEEGATTIRIGALSTPHRMLAKIVQHNLWPVVSVVT